MTQRAMLQRVVKFSKKPEVSPPVFASVSASDIIRAPLAYKTIPLEFVSLLAPFRRHGRLSLRVEDVPQRARLSAGRNNGDGSWSLASDELEGLAYLIPENLVREHTLLLRIMAIEDAGASTLKILPFPVPLESLTSEPEDKATVSGGDPDDPILHNELEQMQSLFAVRESELTRLRVALERAETQKETELAEARTAWELELQERLSKAVTQVKAEWQLEQKARQSAEDGRIAQAETRAGQKNAAERERWQAQAERRMEAEHRRWKTESKAELSKALAEARVHWQAETEQRLKTERQHWQTEGGANLSEAIAQERARGQAEAEQRLKTECQHWQAEGRVNLSVAIAQERASWQAEAEQRLKTEHQHWQAEARANLSEAIAQEHARGLAEAEQRLKTERQHWQAEGRVNLSEAIAQERASWQAEAEQRLKTERQHWQVEGRANLSEAIAQERARGHAEAEQRLETERQRWQAEGRDKFSDAIAQERACWQLETERCIETERKRWNAASAEALSGAEARWKVDEENRFAAAMAEWREQSSRMVAAVSEKYRELESALAESRAQPANLPAVAGSASEASAEELAKMQLLLAERDCELAECRAVLEQERAHWRQELETSLSAAAKTWKADQDTRLAAMVEQSRAQSDVALAAATSRCEAAERALAESRNAPASREDAFIQGLRRELATAQAALVTREVELGRARTALERARLNPAPNIGTRALPGQGGNLADPDAEPAAPRVKSGLVRDFVVAVCLITPVIFFYPRLETYLPDGLKASLAATTASLLGTGTNSAPPVREVAPPPPAINKPNMAVVIHAANVRATPAAKGVVVLTLPRGASVAVLQQHGNWTLVEVASKNGKDKPQQGFVYGAYLKGKTTLPGMESAVSHSSGATPAQ